jgi:putative ABC transport system substrate-binding protein
MKRREFITLRGGAAAWPLAARVQPSGQTRRLVVLMGIARDASAQAAYAQFLQELEKLGWTSGRNIRVDERWGEGDMDRILVQAKELVGLKPDAIFVFGIRALTAMHRQTVTIPIVAYAIPNDYVENRARPAGNVTGFTVSEYSLSGKCVETLNEAAPKLTRVALLHQSDNDATPGYFPSFEAAAQTLGVRSSVMLVHDMAEVERGIKTFAREPNVGAAAGCLFQHAPRSDNWVSSHPSLAGGLLSSRLCHKRWKRPSASKSPPCCSPARTR